MANLLPCPFFIGGEWLRPSLGGTPVFNPSTGDVIAECPAGGAAEVDAAVQAAAAAGSSSATGTWSRRSSTASAA